MKELPNCVNFKPDKAGGWGAIPVKLFPKSFKDVTVSGNEGIVPVKVLKLMSMLVNFVIPESVSLMTAIFEKISGMTPCMVVCVISR
jgi:hypothetical protein